MSDRTEISSGSNLSTSRRLAIVVVLRPIGDRDGLLGWKEDEWRKQAVRVSLVPPEKRPRTKDDDEDEKDWDMTLTVRGVKKLNK